MLDKLVSIITPTFNSAKYVEDTYRSIQKQTYPFWEWVVTDDCSSDTSWSMLKDISAKDPRVKISRNLENSGGAITRNGSLDRAIGNWVAFVDSDDLWYPTKLEKQVAFMSDQVGFSFTAYEIVDESGNRIGRTVDSSFCGSIDYEGMLKKNATLGCSTVMIRRSIIEDLRMPDIRKGQDYAFWLMILRKGQLAHILNEVLTQYRITPNSVSRNKFLKSLAQWGIYRNCEKLTRTKSAYFFGHYAWNAVFKKR